MGSSLYTRPPSVRRSVVIAASIAFLLLAWKLAAEAVRAEILLPPPERVFLRFLSLALSGPFWSAVLATVIRTFAGFSVSLVPAVFLGYWAGRRESVALFLSPAVTVIRSTPVLSVILLALIWFANDAVPVFVAVLMAFPVMYGNIVEGVRGTDPRLLEMARVYRVPRPAVFSRVYLPSLFPFMISGASTALALTWKVVVAAEVLSQPVRAIGSGMQTAKVELETADVFAWTLTALLLSAATEAAFSLWMKRWKRYGNPD
jgi:NitT/TauT family transport system permease protein